MGARVALPIAQCLALRRSLRKQARGRDRIVSRVRQEAAQDCQPRKLTFAKSRALRPRLGSIKQAQDAFAPQLRVYLRGFDEVRRLQLK